MTTASRKSNSLMIHTMCDEYGISNDIDCELRERIGTALLEALNAGFVAGKKEEVPIIEAKELGAKYGVQLAANAEVTDTINYSLYRAFQDGYEQGKVISDFGKYSSGKGGPMQDTATIMDRCAKPEHLIFLNYMTGKPSEK